MRGLPCFGAEHSADTPAGQAGEALDVEDFDNPG